jgi:hypothetical protein
VTITYLGGLELGAAVPGASVAVQAGTTGINSAMVNLSLQLEALQAFVPRALDFAAQLALAQQMVVSIGLAMQAGLTPPDLTAQIAIITAQAAKLAAQIMAIQAQLDVLLALVAPLAAAGVHAYAYDGTAGAFGDELDAELALGVPGGAGPAEHASGVVLVTTIAATWEAMGVILKVEP